MSFIDNFMLGMTQKQRRIDKTFIDNVTVSTAIALDTVAGFETAMVHDDYKVDTWIIVEEYTTRKDAVKGHEKWVSMVRENKLPPYIQDVSTSPDAGAMEQSGTIFYKKGYSPEVKEPQKLLSYKGDL